MTATLIQHFGNYARLSEQITLYSVAQPVVDGRLATRAQLEC